MRIVFDISLIFILINILFEKNEKNIFRLVIDLKIIKKIALFTKKKTMKKSKIYCYYRCRSWWNRSRAINLGKRKNITLIAAKELKIY